MMTQLNRRHFLRRTFAGSTGIALVGTPYWSAATQLLEETALRDIRGIGLADRELVELSINENPLGPSRRAIEEVAKLVISAGLVTPPAPDPAQAAERRKVAKLVT